MKWLKRLFKGYDKYILTIPKGYMGLADTYVNFGYIGSYKFVGYVGLFQTNDPNHKPFTANPVAREQDAIVITAPTSKVSARNFAKHIASCCNEYYDFKVSIKGIE